MKKLSSLFLTAALFYPCMIASAQNENLPPAATKATAEAPAATTIEKADGTTYNIELDFNSRYVFRGQALSSGATFQPTLTATRGNTSASVFVNRNFSNRDGVRFNEFDVSLSKKLERGKTSITPTVVIYAYPRGSQLGDTTSELALRLALKRGKTTYSAEPTIDIWKDRGALIAELGVTREREWSARLSSEATFRIAFGNGKYGETNFDTKRAAAVYTALGLSVTYMLTNDVYVTPHLEYSRVLDGALRRNSDEANLWALGVTTGADF